jgi:CHASE2 domain-containing sensor protein/tRNA A-37 threonylcarbamoyl transferase component Bud32
MSGQGSRRALRLALIALLATGAGVACYAVGALSWIERGSVDLRFSVRGRHRAPADVVIVGIDNASLGVLPRYPFSRVLHARLIRQLHAAGARLIVYDISFDRPTNARADGALLDAAAAGAPIIFATSLISSSGQTEVLGGDANLQPVGDTAAAADLIPDRDGVIRRMLGQVNGLPTVAHAVANEMGRPVTSSELDRAWIDFPGGPGSVATIPFVRVLRGRFDHAAIKGKVVIVGATASVLQDLHSTAAGSPMSGPEVQADAISTVLRDFPLRTPSSTVTLLLIALLGSFAPLVGLRTGTIGVVFAGAGAIALWALTTQLTFDSGVMLDFADPVLALMVGVGGTSIGSIWADRRERMRLRGLFAADAGAMVERVLRPGGPRPLEPTAIIAGYRIEDVVGRGGMGVVYRARQLALDRQVAVKLIAPDRYYDPVLRERFKSESRVAASIEHANVIPVYEAGEDDGLLFIAMRLVDGIDLAQLLDLRGKLSPSSAASLITQLAAALDAAHAHGLVHRDVKPANALITREEPGHLYLTDFGVAMRVGVESRLTQAGWVGTLDYLAPEQILGEQVDSRADIYALAGLSFQCLTGRVPFLRENPSATLWAHVNAPPPAPSRLDPDLSPTLDEVIARGMAKDPAARFATAGALARALAAALGAPRTGSLDGVGADAQATRSREARAKSEPTVISE